MKAAAPDIMVGGPALAHDMRGEKAKTFFAYCRQHDVPMDFISWHGYADHPAKLVAKIEDGLAVVAEHGFGNVETHFTEWNYRANPQAGSVRDPATSRAIFGETAGAPGAAFAAATLAFMHDTRLDAAAFYVAMGGIFRLGMFDRYMLPTQQFHAFRAYRAVADCGNRVVASGGDVQSGLGVLAGAGERRAAVLLANFGDSRERFRLDVAGLPFAGPVRCREQVIDTDRSLDDDREQIVTGEAFSLVVDLPAPSVRLVTLEPA